jgi:hypothetical protein
VGPTMSVSRCSGIFLDWFLALSVCEDSIIIPRGIVVLQGSVKGCEPAFKDEIGDRVLVPVNRAGVDPVRRQVSMVYTRFA